MSEPPLHSDGHQILSILISLTVQSFLYGIYVLLMPFSTHPLLKKGIKSRANKFLIFSLFFPFILSSAYWALEVSDAIVRIQTYFINRSLRLSSNVASYAPLYNAIALLNFVSSDAVVLWRAWALCKEDYRKALLIPTLFFSLVAFSVSSAIGVRIALFYTPFQFPPVERVLDACQISNLVFSLLTNIAATSIISHKTWHYRKLFQEVLRNTRNRSTKAERIMALIIESGIIYCISGAFALFATFIRLPYGTLGDIYTPVNVQIAGIYPTIVLVLVGLERSMNDTTFPNSIQVDAALGNQTTGHLSLRFNTP